jgi:hypothetical protein
LGRAGADMLRDGEPKEFLCDTKGGLGWAEDWLLGVDRAEKMRKCAKASKRANANWRRGHALESRTLSEGCWLNWALLGDGS